MPSSPNTIFSGTTGPESDRPGPNRVLTRVLFWVVATLLFPVGAILYGGWLALFTYGRMPWWLPAPIAAVLTFVGLGFGLLGPEHWVAYAQGWGEFGKGVVTGNLSLGLILNLMLNQVFLGVWLYTCYASVVTTWKWVRRPSWQERKITVGPILTRRAKKTIEAIKTGTDSPVGGLTLGVAMDKRDARFAGGKPGARYGDRVIVTDDEAAGHMLVVGGSGSGKALDVNTPIPTPTGFVRMGDLKTGDKVFGSSGQPVTVVGAFDTMTNHDCYEVCFSDGSVIVADADHLWTVHTIESRKSANRLATISRNRRRVGSDDSIAAVRALVNSNGRSAELVTSTQLKALLAGETDPTVVYNVLKDIPATEKVKVGPFAQDYSGKTVMKTRTVPGWDASVAGNALLARLEGFWHDQRANRVGEPVTITTAQMLGTFREHNDKARYSVPSAGVVEFPEISYVPLDPYLLGLYLGDGGTSKAMFTTADEELLDAWRAEGFNLNRIASQTYDYYITGLQPVLKQLGVFGNKHIPDAYLFTSEGRRRALLAGLLDSDGTHEGRARVSFCNKNEHLADQVLMLAASLGFRPTKTSRFVTHEDGRQLGPYFTISFQANDDVFRLTRKRDSHRAARGAANQRRHNHRYITDIRKVESRPVRCIAVDAEDRLFLAGETFIATHNTTSILIMLRDAIRQGRGIVVVDCKGGPDVPQQISDWCQRYGRDFLHWSIHDPKTPYEGPADGPAFYDPISRGDPSRRKDLLIGSQRWDVEYYKTVNGNYLQTLFTVADLVPPLEGVDSFTDVADLLSANQLLRRAQNIPADLYPELASALTRLGEMEEGERSGIRNMYSRLHTLTSSTAGAWLRRDPEGLRDINLRKAADEGQVVVFSLDTSNYEETATLIAGLIIQDLKTLSSELRHEPAPGPLHVVVDEFSAVDTTNLLGLLAKARDAKMPVCLATQALADLERREPTFVDQVLGIVSAFAVHRANTETDARIYAGLSGVTRKMLERLSLEQTSSILGTFGAASATGVGYLEEKDDYAINVGTFQNLERGQAIYIAKSPTARYVNPVHVIMEDEAAADLQCDPGVEIIIPTRVKPPKKEKVTYPHPALSDMVNIFQPTEVDPAKAVGAPHNGTAPPPTPPGVPQAPQAPRLPTRPRMPRPMNPNAPGQPGIAAGTPLPGMGAPGVKPAGTPMPGISRPGKPSGAHDEWMMP